MTHTASRVFVAHIRLLRSLRALLLTAVATAAATAAGDRWLLQRL
jgi:hypothetical protein